MMNQRRFSPAVSAGIVNVCVLAACGVDENANRLVGQLESDRIEITAEVAEPIIERVVTEGETIEKGQVVIRQDAARATARVAQTNAALEQARARYDELVRGPRHELILAAQASVRGAEKELAFRETDLARAEQVYERKLTSPEVRDRAIVARDTALANLENFSAKLDELLTGTTAEELRQAEAGVHQAEAVLESVRVDLDRHTSVAFSAGVVDSLLFEIGERPGIGQPMAVLLSGNQPHVRTYIPEPLRVHVRPGIAARVFVDGLQDPFVGRVRWVASESTFTPYFALTERDRGRLSYVAKIDIVNAENRLPDGVPVEIELLLEEVDE